MPLDKQSTTLAQSPYYDDYDQTKNFHRVLFKPSVAVQARELTQLQTILQNQIERFGDNIFRTGTIINGCSLTTDDQYYYVKLFDNQVDGSTYTLSALNNTFITQSSSNLTAVSVNFKTGGQQADPDLNTLYIKYLNTGTGGEKAFSNGATLTVFNRNYQVENIIINSGGTLYSNSDTIAFSGGGGTGAVAGVTTFANGTLKSIEITTGGNGYLTSPTATVTTSTGSGANVTAFNYLAQIAVANNQYTAPTGRGFAIKTSEGVVYQKGHFIRVGEHEEIVSKYNTSPNNVVVGFHTTEAVVNSNSDQTLLDNANNATNYTAPGADRLKLSANLVVLSTANAASNNDFLALYEFESGRIIKDRTTTQFNSINKELSKRTFEESGNYVVDPITMYTESKSGNTTHLDLVIGAGLAYVEGNRVQIYNNTKIPLRKSTNTITNDAQTITTNYGGFVYVKELLGNFDIKLGTTVQLRSVAGTDLSDNAGGSPSTPGVQIGTAQVRSLAFDAGTPGTPDCQYRLYIYDVKMSSGFSFKDVRSIAVSGVGIADVVLDSNSNALINDIQFDTLIFPTGTFAVQTLTNETFISRSQTNAAFAVGGTLSVSFSGGNTLPYTAGSTLNSVQERDFIIIPQTTLASSVNKTGTVGTTSGANTVTGTGTLFTADYAVGQFIKVGTQDPLRITKIASNTSITVANNFGASLSSNVHTHAYPANVPIDFQNLNGKTIAIDGSQTTLTLNIGHTLTSTGTVSIYHDIQNVSPTVKVKTVNSPVFVKLSTTSLSTSVTGPWCLGVPDAYELSAVYVGSTNTYSNTTTNYVNEFFLDSGQNDNYYGLSFLKKRPGSTLSLANTNNLLVSLRSFAHGAGKYISTESYSSIIDDVTEPLPSNKIRTQDVPVFTSPKTGRAVDLRNVIDFRPICANTANAGATAVGGATIDPSSTVTFASAEKFFPSPTREFTASVNSYLARQDRVVIDGYGQITVTEGIPANSPSGPSEPRGTMTIGMVNVAPYPSLSAKDAADSGRTDLGVFITPLQNKRYTMKDISDIDRRINRLEYYALLNTLEQNTKQLVLPGEANSSIERFKNGFFVDPLTDYNVSNLNDSEYSIIIDTNRGVGRPNFSDVKVDLAYNSANSTNTVQTGDLITIAYTQKVLLDQPIANKVRTLVDQYWKYKANISLYPPFDNYYDISRSAVSIAIDIATPLNALAKATSDALSQLNVSTNLDKTVNIGAAFQVGTNGDNDVFQQNVEKTITDTKVKINPGQQLISKQDLGDYVTDFTMRPYIREQRIFFFTAGLRPGATHFVFFDNKNVSSSVTPATLNTFTNVNENSFTITGAKGATLVASATGQLAGHIDLPGGTFFVGERNIVIMDVDNVASETSASSKAVASFVAYAYGVNKTNLSISTKTVDVTYDGSFTVGNYTNTYVVSDKVTFERPRPNPDPLSQTFKVQRQLADTDGVFVTGVDVFFKTKDSTNGVTLELRETNNGVPSHLIVPFSRTRLPAANVNISNTANSATTFTFQSPVYLKTETDYAIVIYPDANSPEYQIWTAETGVKDVTNPSLISNQNWGIGTLFYSTSGSAWTPVQDEDLKFVVRRALFNSLSGTAKLQNGDFEFLTLANTEGNFVGGETLAQMSNTYLTGTFTTNTFLNTVTTSTSQTGSLIAGDNVLFIYSNNQVQSTGNIDVTAVTVSNGGGQTTAFTTDYSTGDFIRIGNEIRQIVAVTNSTSMTVDAQLGSAASNSTHFRMDPVFDVSRVTSANSSTITINKVPKLNSNASIIVSAQKVVRGVVSAYDYGNNKIYISSSTSANDTFKIFTSNSSYRGTIVGDTSLATGVVSSVDNIQVNIFRPLINALQVPGTSVSLNGTLTTNSGSTNTKSYSLTSSNKLDLGDDALIKSKTNEITGTTITKSFHADLLMSGATTDISPIVDINPSSVILTRNLINNDSTGETGRFGSARSKYVSKRIVLADGLDAEDAKVFITAYKPNGTTIEVYAKILNFTDGSAFEDKDWTELAQVTSGGVFSDSLNEEDFREYEFTFPKTPPSTLLSGVVTTFSNTTITGLDTTFTSTLAVGNLVKIVKSNPETDYDLIPVTAIANNTSLTVASNISFTGTGNNIELVTQKQAAFKYTRNNYIVRYHDSNGAAFDTYKYLAVKIVLLSPFNYLVPTLNDVRVLAVST